MPEPGKPSEAEPAGERFDTRQALVQRIRSSGTLPPETDPDKAISAVLRTLVARLNQGEAVRFLRSLPENLKPLLEAAVARHAQRGMIFDRDQFNQMVAERLRILPEAAENLSREVFSAIREWISAEDSMDLESQLPKDLKSLWRAA